MGLVDQAAARVDAADLIILANVETIRDQEQPATASAVASLIGGAPVMDVLKRLFKLEDLGAVDKTLTSGSFQLTAMGEGLLRREMEGWSPSTREQQRRDDQLRFAAMRAIRPF